MSSVPPPPPAADSQWRDPASAPPAAARPRRWLVPLAWLLAGLILGGLVGFGVYRLRGQGVTEVQVNSSPVGGSENAPEQVASKLTPAVATVINIQGQGGGLGSAVVMAHDDHVSYLLTNNHVVAGATSLTVLLPDGKTFDKATLVGADTLDDVAVISVPDTTLPVATFGKSSTLKVGQEVVAIGSPLGNESSVTAGIISALHRTINAGDQNASKSETLEDVLQTDASINPGNSGGPLADSNGDVIGINVAVSSGGTNIGYSIPSDLARRVAEQLIAHQPVQHPFLGVAYYDAIDAVQNGKSFTGPGVLVTQLEPGAPAVKAGVQVNDIIVSVDGTDIDNGNTLGGLIQGHSDGDTVHLGIKRGSQTLTLSAVLEERPAGITG